MGPETLQIPIDENYATNETDDEQTDRETYSSGRTLATTVTSYLYENGRRYHSYREGEYYQPNDDQVNSHEIIAHHLWLLTLDDKLYIAPIQDPQKILDLGTGTGLWAMDMADHFPSAEITATDLSPIQTSVVPPNLHFEIDDFTAPWTYPENSFDFVHLRYLFGCMPDQLALYREAFKHMRPGGYIEQLEFHMKILPMPPSDPAADEVYNKLTDAISEAGIRFGKTFDMAENMGRLLEEAGFIDIVENKFRWPLGGWPTDPKLKEIGRWNVRNWEEGMEGWVMALFTRGLGWTYQEVQDFLSLVKKTVKDRKLHYYHEVWAVYARKPL